MSSNPFRKKPTTSIDTTRAGSPKSSMRSEDPLSAGERKNKPTKKVRVLSPPPPSPRWPDSYDVPYANHEAGSSGPPDAAEQIDRLGHGNVTLALMPSPSPSSRPQPANPFSKTLQEIEGSKDLIKERREEGEALKAANESRKSFSVDSFRRLLLTGNAGHEFSSAPATNEDSSSTEQKPAATVAVPPRRDADADADADAGAGAGADDSSADSSTGPEEDQDTSDDTAFSHQMKPEKKAAAVLPPPPPPPPPPSSRHGRSLREHGLENGQRERPDTRQTTPISRPVASPVTRRSMDDEAASPLGRETTAAASEGLADVDLPGKPANSRTGTGKRSAPAPPPPRGRPRSDSKMSENETQHPSPADHQVLHRSDSARSNGPAPAPPPPRRPHHAARQSSQMSTSSAVASPPPSLNTAQSSPSADRQHFDGPPSSSSSASSASSSSSSSSSPDASSLPAASAHGKPTSSSSSNSAPPPPPPARNSTTRRPASLYNVEVSHRRISSESRREGAPPPPPSRQPGSSTSHTKPATTERLVPPDTGKSADILADLDALQREVDALRDKAN